MYDFRIFAQGALYTIYVMLNVFFCLDLQLILKQPFQQKAKLMHYYLAISAIVGFTGGCVYYYDVESFAVFSMSILMIYVIVMIWTSIYCIVRIPNSGLTF